MNKVKEVIKLLLKCVYINNVFKFQIGKGSGVGAFSRIVFSSDTPNTNQSITIGNHAGVGRFCELHVWENNHILIKDHSTLNDGCKILGDVTIERHCLFSANIFASSGNHYALENPSWLIKDQDTYVLSSEEGRSKHSKPIRVEEDCWIGYGVFIKQGIYIGRGAIIGANSVVTKDVEPYSIQVGSPSKEIRRRFEFIPPASIESQLDEHLPYFYRGFDQKRSALNISRKENVIFAGKELIAVLASGDFRVLQFSGSAIKNIKGLQLIVLWQGKYEWCLNINSPNFDFSLSLDTSYEARSKEAVSIFNSIGNEMKKFNVICFHIVNGDGIEDPLGFSSIKVTNP